MSEEPLRYPPGDQGHRPFPHTGKPIAATTNLLPKQSQLVDAPTPETDAALLGMKCYATEGPGIGLDRRTVGNGEVVRADFARKLERELREMTTACSVRDDEVTGLMGQLLEARAEAQQLQARMQDCGFPNTELTINQLKAAAALLREALENVMPIFIGKFLTGEEHRRISDAKKVLAAVRPQP
jgi:hypothetical protein